MSTDYFFDAVFLDDCDWDGGRVVDQLAAASDRVGFTSKGEARADEDWVHLSLRRNSTLDVSVSVSVSEAGWVVMLGDDQLRWADGTVDEEAQGALLDLLRGLLEAATPYVGVACWPFGPSAPEVYDTSKPFGLRQVGSVLFLSDRYVEIHTAGSDLAEAPVWRRERLDGGVLLAADRDLLRSAADGELDDLRRFFGLPAPS